VYCYATHETTTICLIPLVNSIFKKKVSLPLVKSTLKKSCKLPHRCAYCKHFIEAIFNILKMKVVLGNSNCRLTKNLYPSLTLITYCYALGNSWIYVAVHLIGPRWLVYARLLVHCSMFTLRASCGAVYCNRSCLCVCLWVCVLWVCYRDNSKLGASIFTKLGL